MKDKEILAVKMTNVIYGDYIFDKYIKDVYHKDYLNKNIKYRSDKVGLKELKEYMELFYKTNPKTHPIITFEDEQARLRNKYGSEEFLLYILKNHEDKIFKTTRLELTKQYRWEIDDMETASHKGMEIFFIDHIFRILCKESLKFKEQEYIKSLMNANPGYFRGCINLNHLFSLYPELKKHYALIESGYIKKEINYSDNDNNLIYQHNKNKKRL